MAYAIGVSHPLSIHVDTFGTGKISDKILEEFLIEDKLFNFRPAGLIKDLGLLHPEGWSYKETAAYGHFGRNIFPWEKCDKANDLIKKLS